MFVLLWEKVREDTCWVTLWFRKCRLLFTVLSLQNPNVWASDLVSSYSLLHQLLSCFLNLTLLLLLLLLCVCLSGCECAHEGCERNMLAIAQMWRLGENFVELILSYFCVGSRNGTQATRFVCGWNPFTSWTVSPCLFVWYVAISHSCLTWTNEHLSLFFSRCVSFSPA